MKRIAIEYGCIDLAGKEPTRFFIRQIQEQFTKYVPRLIKDSMAQETFLSLICLRIGARELSGYSFSSDSNSMPLRVEAKSSSLGLCEGLVFWRSPNGAPIAPWELCTNTELSFSFQIEPCEIQKFNWMLSRLYAPVVRANESQLPFDYQIYNISEGYLIFCFGSKPTTSDVSQVMETIHRTGANYIGLPSVGKMQIKVPIDFGGSSIKNIESLIHSFSNLSGLKKIIFRE